MSDLNERKIERITSQRRLDFYSRRATFTATIRVVKPNRPNRLTECLNRFDQNRKPQKTSWTEPIKKLPFWDLKIVTNIFIFT